MSDKIISEKDAFIKRANEIKEQLKEQRELERQENPPKEILKNTERTNAIAKHANESKAALGELMREIEQMSHRAGYDNMDSAMAKVADFCRLLYKFLVAERDGFFAQSFQEPLVRDIPIAEKIPSDLRDFLEIDKDGKLNLAKLKGLSHPDRTNLDVAVTKFLESKSYKKEGDVFKKDGVVLTPDKFELLGSIDNFFGNLSEEHFTPPPPVPAPAP